MSSVRMCDRCGSIFSEREEGWSSVQSQRTVKDDTGRRVTVNENLDVCSGCGVGGGPSVPTPRLALVQADAVDPR